MLDPGPFAVTGGIVWIAAGLLLAAIVVVAYLAWLSRRPLTDTDAYCSRVDDELDFAERRARVVGGLDVVGAGVDRVWRDRDREREAA